MVRKKNKLLVLTLMLSILFCIIIATSFSQITALAEAGSDNIATVEECKEVADNWLKQNYNDETKIDEVIPIMAGEKISSYCVNFQNNGDPNGYIVIEANKNISNYILEFSLSGKGIYDTLCENAGVQSEKSEKLIYSLGAYDYAISTNKDTFYASYGANITKTVINKIGEVLQNVKSNIPSPLNYTDNMVWGSSLGNTFTSYTITGADAFVPTTMDNYRISGSFEGNCCPTAGANILNFYREQRGFDRLGTSRQDVYNKVVGASGWNQYGKEGMSYSELKTAMKSVVKSSGYTFAYDTYWYEHWSSWTRDLGKDYTVFTAFYGYKTINGEQVESGHAVVAIGYREYDSSGQKYLRIYDGWYESNNRYLLFKSSTMTSIDGIRMNVK